MMPFSEELLVKLRKAFRDQLDGERVVDGLPPLTDGRYNWWCEQLKRESPDHLLRTRVTTDGSA